MKQDHTASRLVELQVKFDCLFDRLKIQKKNLKMLMIYGNCYYKSLDFNNSLLFRFKLETLEPVMKKKLRKLEWSTKLPSLVFAYCCGF